MNAAVLPAPIWRRLTAAVYDLLLLAGLWLAAQLVAVLFSDLAGLTLHPSFTRAYLFLISFGFFGWFWTHGGQTLGMRVWRLRVRKTDGGTLNLAVAMRRFALAVPLGLSVLWSWADPARRAWHDRLSGTEVVLLPPS